MHSNTSVKRVSHALMAMFGAALLMAACASVDKDATLKEIGNAQSAITQAKASDAEEHAPLELRKAEDKLVRANQAINEGDTKKAKYLAEEAGAEANLAESKAETAKTKQTLQELRDSVGQLRQEIERNQTTQD